MEFNNMKSLSESVVMHGLSLAESAKWRDYSVAIREGYREKTGKSIPETILATTATLLENTYNYCNRMDETTRVVNLGSFVDYGFDVISATVPNLISHDIVSVQPMNAKHGAIFYLQYLYGGNGREGAQGNKGSITAGSVMNSPFTGIDGNTNYSNDRVVGESIGLGTGSQATFSTTLGYTPVRPGSVIIPNPIANSLPLATDDGNGNFVGNGATGTINYETGAISVTFTSAPANDAAVTVDYRYDMDLTTVGFSQVDLDLQSISLEAFPRKLRSRWLLDAGFELQKMKGIDAESELIVAMSSEIKYEIDGEILNDLFRLAAHTMNKEGKPFTWDCQLPAGSGISYIDYKRTIMDLFTEMSNTIFTSTKRVGANIIVAGVNVCNIIETLPEFEAANTGIGQINGPHYIGELAGKWKVYKNPFYGDNNFVLGYKGSSYLDAGYVYAPYMPLYATPTTVLDDFIFRKGLATSYGTVMLNNKLYAKGSIENFTATRMINQSPIIVKNVD